MLDVQRVVKTSLMGSQIYMPPKYRDLNFTMGYEKLTLQLFSRFLKPNQNFVDVGAHVGFFSVTAGKKVGPKGRVFAFEPLKSNVKILKKNIELNKLSNIKIINEALSSSVSSKTLRVREDTGLTGFYEHPLGETIKKIKVKTSTIDHYFKSKKVDFIKIDTEGHELDILKGATETIKNNPAIKLIIELNPGSLKNAGVKPENLLEFLIAYDFEIFSIDDQLCEVHRLTNNYKNWQKVFPVYGYSNLLCIPKKEAASLLIFSHTNQIYGAERSLVEISNTLLNQNMLVTVVKPKGGKLSQLLKDAGIPYVDSSSPVWWCYPQREQKIQSPQDFIKKGAPLIGEYLEVIKKFDYEFVATNSIVQPWVAASAKILSKPHFWFLHEFVDTLKCVFTKEQMIKFIDNNSFKIIASSLSLKKDLSKFFDSSKIKIIYPNIELKMIKSKKRYYKNPKALHLISIGNISANKRQLDLLEATKTLNDNSINTELLIVGTVGDQEYNKNISNYIKKNKLQNQVLVKDEVKEVYPLLEQADVVVVSSEKESFGRVIIEGMLAYKIVVATKSGGPQEIINHGENGFLYSVGDVHELVGILTELSQNNALKERISSNAFKNCKKIISKNSVTVLSKLLKNSKFDDEEPILSALLSAIIENEKTTRLMYESSVEKTTQLQEQYQQITQNLKAERDQLKLSLETVLNSKSFKFASKLASLKRNITRLKSNKSK